MSETPKMHAAYWRGIVAGGATIETCHVTQFSPDGLGKALGQAVYYVVTLGPNLYLKKDGKWDWWLRGMTVEQRVAGAHKTMREALEALRADVAPDEPACADAIERIYRIGSL